MKLFIGLLSGTSVDGIDAAVVAVEKKTTKLIASHHQAFSDTLKKDLQYIIKSQQLSLQRLADTDSLLAFEFAQAVEILIKKSNLKKQQITAIGSHGQTIYHQPNGNHKNTLQIGSAHKIAAYTGITVVANFRNLDMAYDGQGAPLAPIIHQHLFNDKDNNSAIINLGGIANISFIGKDYSSPIGYDIGPANCLMDEWIFIHKQQAFDDNGCWASQGKLNTTLLSQMLADDYFQKSIPKSTGREYFNHLWYNNFIETFKTTSAIDIQTTLCHLVAASIQLAIDKAPHHIDKIILMGGGTHNGFLVSLIKQYTKIKTITANDLGYDSDWIEAMLFAFLAAKRIHNEKLDLHSFTGSTRALLVGDIIVP